MNIRRPLLAFVALLAAFATSAQRRDPASRPSGDRINLDTVVTEKSGSPVTGLQQQDFAILDNKVPQTITSFRALAGTQTPVGMVIVIDAVNAKYITVSYERHQIDQFLRADHGDIVYPTALFVLTDTGLDTVEDFSKDGNQLSAALDKYAVSTRILNRSAGFYGAADRYQISLDGLHQLARRESSRPGRKIMVWISPGWPLLSGPEVELDDKEQQQIFGDIVDFSTELRADRITLYNIDPAGMFDSLARDTYWEDFVKGVSKPGQAQAGNLGLEVLTTQSGGVVDSFNNDITGLLRKCVADTRASYEISFEPPADGQSNEYHHLEVRVAKHGLTARTLQGYYSRPSSQWQQPATPIPVHTGDRGAGIR
ncbi:MAG TPA: VWA domain-containing protein [Candidatus Acidoferrales bacterium]